jgi:O-antigen/teichoic acid export membrane protein
LRERLNNLLPHGSFIRNVGILTGGTIVSQFIIIATLPLLTRLYTPEEFGILSVYVSIMNVLVSVSCLRYNIAIPIPEKDSDGLALLIISITSAIFISIAIAVFIFFNKQFILKYLDQPQLEPYLWMIPVGTLLAASYDALQYWASRMKRFHIITRTRITRAAGAAATQLSIGFPNGSSFGLLAGQLVYSGLGNWGLLASLARNERTEWRNISFRRVIHQAKRNYKFPLFAAPEALLNTASIELPIILIAALAVGPEAGYLMLATRIMGMPMTLIGSSVAQVYLAEARVKQKDGSLSQFSRSTMWNLFKFGAPPLIVCGLLSPIIFPILFGNAWDRAGWLMAWMTPWFILQLVVSPVSVALHVLGKQVISTILQGLGLTLRVGAILIATKFQPAITSEAYAVSGVVFYLIYLFIVINAIEDRI